LEGGRHDSRPAAFGSIARTLTAIMKAIVQTRYGDPQDVLELREIDTPEVEDDEVLVRVRATSVHADV
jgi:D-arabinose 1-dehydrogenase-like Zn-dependent alcohol dehydrogenase